MVDFGHKLQITRDRGIEVRLITLNSADYGLNSPDSNTLNLFFMHNSLFLLMLWSGNLGTRKGVIGTKL